MCSLSFWELDIPNPKTTHSMRSALRFPCMFQVGFDTFPHSKSVNLNMIEMFESNMFVQNAFRVKNHWKTRRIHPSSPFNKKN